MGLGYPNPTLFASKAAATAGCVAASGAPPPDASVEEELRLDVVLRRDWGLARPRT